MGGDIAQFHRSLNVVPPERSCVLEVTNKQTIIVLVDRLTGTVGHHLTVTTTTSCTMLLLVVLPPPRTLLSFFLLFICLFPANKTQKIRTDVSLLTLICNSLTRVLLQIQLFRLHNKNVATESLNFSDTSRQNVTSCQNCPSLTSEWTSSQSEDSFHFTDEIRAVGLCSIRFSTQSGRVRVLKVVLFL